MRDHNDNSGVFIRIPLEPREEWMPVHYGYEVQIDNQPEDSKEDEYHVTGTLYSLTKPLARPGKPGPEWNTMVITLDGPHTIVVVNDVKVTDYTEGQPVPARKFDFEPQHGTRPNEGWIGLQNHSDNDIVFFKEVAVQPLQVSVSRVRPLGPTSRLQGGRFSRAGTAFDSLRRLCKSRASMSNPRRPPMKKDLTRRQFLHRTAARRRTRRHELHLPSRRAS